MKNVNILPLFSPLVPDKLPNGVKEVLFTFGPYNILSAACFLVCLFFISRFSKNFSSPYCMAAVTAVIFICLLGSPMKAVDTMKSMKTDIQSLWIKIYPCCHIVWLIL